jgi:WD40 repeat protein
MDQQPHRAQGLTQYTALLRQQSSCTEHTLTPASDSLCCPVPVPPGGQQLVTSTSDVPGLLVWDMRSGKVEQNLTTEAPVGSMDVSGCCWVLVLTCVAASVGLHGHTWSAASQQGS